MATTETKQVYIFGHKQGVEQCMSNLTGLTPHLGNDVCAVSENTPIRNGDPSMENLKEYMDCDNDASVNLDKGKRPHMASTEASVKMKRLKSTGSSTESNASYSVGYESDNTETDGKALTADINAIVSEDYSGLHKTVASFIIKLITLPALIILAVDSENFDHVFYVNLFKELSVLASMKGDETSKLLMVGINHKCTAKDYGEANELMEQRQNEFQCDISETYFGENFDWCEIENMRRTLRQVTNKMGWRFCTGIVERKALSTLFEDIIFIETKTVTETDFANPIFKFTSHKKEYMCRPKDLINLFVRALKKMSDMRYALKKLEFFRLINFVNYSDRSKFKDALKQIGLIHTEKIGTDETVYVMPLVCSKNVHVFSKKKRYVNTSVLKLTVELCIIPVLVKVNIINKLFHVHKWTFKSTGPIMDSYLFEKEKRELFVLCGSSTETTSYICLCGFGSEHSSDGEYESLRNEIEVELRKWKGTDTNEEKFICYYIKHNNIQDEIDILNTTAKDWTEGDFKQMKTLVDARKYKLLLPWFLLKVNEIKTEASNELSDVFLADVVCLFGLGYKLFFTVEGIPAERLSQIEIDHSKSVKDQIMKMLLEWRKIKGLEANIDALRSAIINSSHLTTNITSFDELVTKHHGET